jgi:hypothetical protein
MRSATTHASPECFTLLIVSKVVVYLPILAGGGDGAHPEAAVENLGLNSARGRRGPGLGWPADCRVTVCRDP